MNFLSPTNSAECRACGVRRAFKELHHHGGFMNYRCKDKERCERVSDLLSEEEVREVNDESLADLDVERRDSALEFAGVDDDPIERDW